jgi:S-adenosyl-L-methionine hydrolase (adenosine-forming)
MRRGVITFTSDFGLEDEYVGVCHGVILKIAPAVRIVDVLHAVAPQDLRRGALVLAQAVRFMPDAVHLAVVDPGVGSERAAMIVESASGDLFVGPDNGLLMPAVEATGGASRATRISNERFLLTPRSHTFHGRDVFAPAAAHLANGVAPAELGPPVPVDALVRLSLPEARVEGGRIRAEVLQIDRFGNVQLNLRPDLLAEVGLRLGEPLLVVLDGQGVPMASGPTYASVAPGRLILLEDSYGYLAIAVNGGDAAARLGAGPGSTAVVEPGPSRSSD